jgi:hypothetical protein
MAGGTPAQAGPAASAGAASASPADGAVSSPQDDAASRPAATASPAGSNVGGSAPGEAQAPAPGGTQAPAPAAAKPPKVTVAKATIPTYGKFPAAITLADDGLLYVADYTKPVVTVIDTSTDRRVGIIRVPGKTPTELADLAVTPGRLFILDSANAKLHIADTAQRKVVRTLSLKAKAGAFDTPERLVLAPNVRTLYIGAHYGKRLVTYNLVTRKLGRTYSLKPALKNFPAERHPGGTQLVDMAFSDSGRYAYLSLDTTWGEDAFAQVSVLDLKTGKILANESSKAHPWGTPNTEFYHVVNVGHDVVYRSVSTEVAAGDPFYVEALNLSKPRRILSRQRL